MVENVKELLKLHEGITHEVYLDNENSSIVPQEVVDEMMPYFNKKAYGNPTLTTQARLGSLRSNNELLSKNQQIPWVQKTSKISPSLQAKQKPTT